MLLLKRWIVETWSLASSAHVLSSVLHVVSAYFPSRPDGCKIWVQTGSRSITSYLTYFTYFQIIVFVVHVAVILGRENIELTGGSGGDGEDAEMAIFPFYLVVFNLSFLFLLHGEKML